MLTTRTKKKWKSSRLLRAFSSCIIYSTANTQRNRRVVLCPFDGRRRWRCVRPVWETFPSLWTVHKPADRTKTHHWPVMRLQTRAGCLEEWSRGPAESSWTASASTPRHRHPSHRNYLKPPSWIILRGRPKAEVLLPAETESRPKVT